MESGRKKKKDLPRQNRISKSQGKKRILKPSRKKKKKKACYIQRIKKQNNIKFLKNDTEARRSKLWEKNNF